MRVVIAGGGFGGVRAALNLANKKGFEVKLVSNQNYFEYHAALYRSATGRSPLEVAIPLRDFFAYANNVEVVADTAAALDAEARALSGQSGARYPYDALILALGNVTEYYGISGLAENSFGVKTIHEALRLKRHLHEHLLNKDVDSNYVVIGAGATGVELAAEMASYLKDIRRRHKVDNEFTVNLVEAAPRAVAAMPASYSRAVEKRLARLGVRTYFNAAVESSSSGGITIPQGDIATSTVVWTAGVANNPFFAAHKKVFTLGKNQRVKVDDYLMGAPDVYVIGDAADTPYSGMAQTALHNANFVTDDIRRRAHGHSRRTYRPKRPIYAIPVGARWAAVLWGKTQINGTLGWILRRLADLRLYLNFLPFNKALTTWRYGFETEEICQVCKK